MEERAYSLKKSCCPSVIRYNKIYSKAEENPLSKLEEHNRNGQLMNRNPRSYFHPQEPKIMLNSGTTLSAFQFDSKTNIAYSRNYTKLRPYQRKKCVSLYIGGAHKECGVCTSSFRPIPCNRLRCTRCNQEVFRFKGKSFDAEMDYIFLRSFFGNKEKLEQRMNEKSQYAAYCCSCTWTDSFEMVPLPALLSNWKCAGH